MSAPAKTVGPLDSAPLRSAPSRFRPRFAPLAEALLAALAAAMLYAGLYGELPHHDVARFVAQINSGRFVWDIGHIFLQPATLVWHTHLGFGETAEASQKHINTFATAAGIGIFYALLQWLGVSAWQRVLATVVVACSFSLIVLAPSGHMKLLAFPFVNASLFMLVRWEARRGMPSGPGLGGCLFAGAVLLALAASFLASALATAPFATLAILATRLRNRDGWLKALVSSGFFAVVCGVTFVLLVCIGYTLFAGSAPSLHGLAGSVADKAELRPPTYNVVASMARLVFTSVNNLIYAPDTGPVLRAWISGQVPSLAPYARVLVLQALPSLLTLALLLATYLLAVRAVVSGVSCLVPVAFLCGALAWSAYYDLNDPEHRFLATVPTVILFLLLVPPRIGRLVLPCWAVMTAAINVFIYAVPYATYPLKTYEAQLRRTFTSNDLLIGFAAYSGGPSVAFLDLPGVPQLRLDTRLDESADLNAFYAGVDRDIAAALARHGRVVVLGNVLDPYDWNAPWVDLPARGVRKQQLIEFFTGHYKVEPAGSIAGLKAWEILPADSGPAR